MTDLRYALRTLGRAPGFTAMAALTLALGIGANTAIFTLVNAVILKPLPYREPSRLVIVWDNYKPQFSKLGISSAELQAWQAQTDLFSESAWWQYVPTDLGLTVRGAEPLEVHATIVSPKLGPLLGVAPALGHAFTENEPPDSVLLSDRIWRERLGGDRSVVGKTVRLNEREYTVAGVMPRSAFPDWADVWLPPGPLLADYLTNPVRHALGFVARLRPGISQAQAAAALEAVSRRLAAEHPKTSTGWGMTVSGLQDDLISGLRPALRLLWGAVGLVLLIACVNIANLLLARASSRGKELSVRAALGASTGRMVRQLLTESLLLSALGGILAVPLAAAALWAAAPMRTGLDAPLLDATVLGFLLAIAAATGVLAGIAPVWQAVRSDLNVAIRVGSLPGGGSSRLRDVLVAAEFALAMMLATGAGLLSRDYVKLMHVDPGFDPHGLLTLKISAPPSHKPDELFRRLERSIGSLPGVREVAVANVLPLVATRANTSRFSVPGSPLINPDALPGAQVRAVSPAYFRAMKIPLRSGRPFEERDLTGDSVIINETMARRFWPGRDPVGQRFVIGPWGPKPNWGTIVGVAGDVKQFGLDSEPSFDLYFPSLGSRYLIVRTAGDPAALAGVVRREIHAADSDAPVEDVRSMEDVLTESAHSRRWTMALLAAFAGLAMLLSAVGIYGVMSWSVAQRTREIGIRMALGAARPNVLAMVLRHGLRLSGIGLALGVAGAWAFRRVLASMMFGSQGSGVWIYGIAAAVLLAAALAAVYGPARRASRMDPLAALRWE